MRALLPFSLLCFACLEPVEGRLSASTDTPSTSPDIAPDIGPDIAPDADGPDTPDTPDATSDSDAATPCTTVRFESLTRRESTLSPGYEMYITLKAAAVGSAPLAYHWALTEVPFGRDAQLSTPVRSDTAQFTATVPGTYEVSLAVTDAAGVRSCTATRRIDVPPPTYGLFIEALWTAPSAGLTADGAPAPDLDLHFQNPQAAGAFDVPRDAFWFNHNPDWGGPGAPDDDPFLEDAVAPPGRETVYLRQYQWDGRYCVDVHHWDGPDGVAVRVRCFADGVLIADVEHPGLDRRDLLHAPCFTWSGNASTMTLDLRGDVTPDFNPIGFGSP